MNERTLATRPGRIRDSSAMSFKVPVPGGVKVRCDRCDGTGKAGGRKVAGHKAHCKCFACKQCRHCTGSGIVAGPARVKPTKNVDVIEEVIE